MIEVFPAPKNPVNTVIGMLGIIYVRVGNTSSPNLETINACIDILILDVFSALSSLCNVC